MSDEPAPFTPYQCSLGTVLDHGETGTIYRVQLPDGTVRAVEANGTPSPEAVEYDIENPPVQLATAAEIAAYRWKVETGGVNITVSTGTHRFDTTRENRVMWVALAGAAQANPALTQGWKTLDHGFVTLTAADIGAIYAAIFAHVAACFAKEAELLAAPPPLADLPNAGWPA